MGGVGVIWGWDDWAEVGGKEQVMSQLGLAGGGQSKLAKYKTSEPILVELELGAHVWA